MKCPATSRAKASAGNIPARMLLKLKISFTPASGLPARMNEQELLADCLRRLNRTGITYYLTGSMASNYWGIPRTTHDLDFVVQLPMSAVPRILHEFSGDFYIEEAAVRAAYQPPHQFNAIDTRSALKVDFWLPKPEPFDREMLRRRAQVTLFGVPAWISTAEDVI